MPRKLFTSLLDPSTKVTEDQLETDVNLLNMEKSILAMNRRHFLGGLAAAGATAAIGATALATPAEAQSATQALLSILNFALNLEYLEANFYLSVSGGAALSPSDTSGTAAGAPGGAVIDGMTPSNLPGTLALDGPTQALAAALAADEVAHIQLLRSAITSNGGSPIAQPAIDYSAGGTVTVATQAQFLAVARQFTAVGNSAYAGAAANFIATPSLLTAAAQILGAEGQHLGAINYLCVLQGIVSPAVDTLDVPPSTSPINFFTATPISTPFYPSQPPVVMTGTPPVAVTPTVFAPTAAANGIQRSVSDVLGIVYGVTTASMNQPPSTGVAKGGFFPSGVNGSAGFLTT